MRFTDKRETGAAEGGISYDRTCCNGPCNFGLTVSLLTDPVSWNHSEDIGRIYGTLTGVHESLDPRGRDLDSSMRDDG